MAEIAAVAKTGKPPKRRQRSPEHPFINLETAIGRAKTFYEHEQRNAAPLKVAVKHWGYDEKSSGGLQTVAALISFGLMADEGTGDKRTLKLTPNALRILLDARPDSADRVAAIQGAALTPKIHQQLWRKWGNKIPSDDNVRHILILDWIPPFNPSVVDSFIKEYRDTIAFARPDDSAVVPLSGDDPNAESEAGGANMQNQERASMPPPNPAAVVIPASVTGSKPVGSGIPVSESCVMSIEATGDVTQKGIEQLIAYLNLIKGSFPKGE